MTDKTVIVADDDWLPDMAEADDDTIRDLWHSINHLRRLQEAEPVSLAARLRRDESIARTRREIARLMRG